MNVVYHPADQTYRVGGRVFTAQVVAEMLMTRPYEKLTGSELSRVFADQLQSGGPIQRPKPVEATAFGDTNRSWLMGDGTISGSSNVETTFRVGADGRPEAVTCLVDAPSKGAARNGGESELAWLKRRVDEICWSPR